MKCEAPGVPHHITAYSTTTKANHRFVGFLFFFCHKNQVIVFNFLLEVTHAQLHKDSLSSLRSKREEWPLSVTLDENTKRRSCHSPQRESQLLLNRTALALAQQNAAGSSQHYSVQFKGTISSCNSTESCSTFPLLFPVKEEGLGVSFTSCFLPITYSPISLSLFCRATLSQINPTLPICIQLLYYHFYRQQFNCVRELCWKTSRNSPPAARSYSAFVLS